MPEFDQSLYWKLVPYFRVPMERVHVILVVSGPSSREANTYYIASLEAITPSREANIYYIASREGG